MNESRHTAVEPDGDQSKDASEIYTVSPSLIPVSAYVSGFLKGYASQCRPR